MGMLPRSQMAFSLPQSPRSSLIVLALIHCYQFGGLVDRQRIVASASYCGTSGVPFSFEVLTNGAPVLGCARPNDCLLETDGDASGGGVGQSLGERLREQRNETLEFQNGRRFLVYPNGKPDGFFRGGGSLTHGRLSVSDGLLMTFNEEIKNCSGGFHQLTCAPERNEWVGGIEYIDHPSQPLVLRCCTFEPLRRSEEVSRSVVSPGEAISGGEIVRNGRTVAFDAIVNVRKRTLTSATGSSVLSGRTGASSSGGGSLLPSKTTMTAVTASYEVTVRRLKCITPAISEEVVERRRYNDDDEGGGERRTVTPPPTLVTTLETRHLRTPNETTAAATGAITPSEQDAADASKSTTIAVPPPSAPVALSSSYAFTTAASSSPTSTTPIGDDENGVVSPSNNDDDTTSRSIAADAMRSYTRLPLVKIGSIEAKMPPRSDNGESSRRQRLGGGGGAGADEDAADGGGDSSSNYYHQYNYYSSKAPPASSTVALIRRHFSGTNKHAPLLELRKSPQRLSSPPAGADFSRGAAEGFLPPQTLSGYYSGGGTAEAGGSFGPPLLVGGGAAAPQGDGFAPTRSVYYTRKQQHNQYHRHPYASATPSPSAQRTYQHHRAYGVNTNFNDDHYHHHFPSSSPAHVADDGWSAASSPFIGAHLRDTYYHTNSGGGGADGGGGSYDSGRVAAAVTAAAGVGESSSPALFFSNQHHQQRQFNTNSDDFSGSSSAYPIQSSPQQQQSYYQEQSQEPSVVTSFWFKEGTLPTYCSYGVNPIPVYNTPRKRCVPWHPLCGITFTCIMDV